MAVLIATSLAGTLNVSSLKSLAQETQGRLYYQATLDNFGAEPTPTPPPSIILLAAGAKWAAGNGTRTLYVNWYDTWLAHHITDGIAWGPWPTEETLVNMTFPVSLALNISGLNVVRSGDLPTDLTGYDLVVVDSYWAVEPRHCSLIKDYLTSGGGVVLLYGVPEYFRAYCKDWWTYVCPTAPESAGMREWLGFDYYCNAGGNATIAVDNPFDTDLLEGDLLYQGVGYSNAAVGGGDAIIIAKWDIGYSFACIHEYPEPPPPPIEIPQGDLPIPPSMVLFGAGAKWAAGNGTRALYVDWYSNWIAHRSTDGASWGPWPQMLDMKNWTESIGYVLNKTGLNVTFTADIPDNLTGYDLLVLHAYWAVEPKHSVFIENFLANGGGVVLLSGVPEYFRVYCKDWWTYRCPMANESIDMMNWFGNASYANTGGNATVSFNNPFDTSLLAGDVLLSNCGGSNAAIVDGDAQIVARWDCNYTFAFSREYGSGRLYYQAAFENMDPPNKPGPVGDVSGPVRALPDGKVDMRDISYLVQIFAARPGSSKWNQRADLIPDKVINMREISLCIRHFGER